MREEAIAKRDSSLLPRCTDRYVGWRNARIEEKKKRGELLMPPGVDFWSAPGCRARVDFVVSGPRSRPAPDEPSIGHSLEERERLLEQAEGVPSYGAEDSN